MASSFNNAEILTYVVNTLLLKFTLKYYLI